MNNTKVSLIIVSILSLSACDDSSNNSNGDADLDLCREVYVDGVILPLNQYDVSIPWQRDTRVTGYLLNGEVIPHNVCNDEYAIYDKHTSIYGHNYFWAKHGEYFREDGKPTKVIKEYSPNQDASYWLEGSVGKLVPDDNSPDFVFIYGSSTFKDMTPNSNYQIHYQDTGIPAYKSWRVIIENTIDSTKTISNYVQSGYEAKCVYQDAFNRFGLNYSESVTYNGDSGCDNAALLDDKYLVTTPFDDLPEVMPDRLVSVQSSGWSFFGGDIQFYIDMKNTNAISYNVSLRFKVDGNIIYSKDDILNAHRTTTIEATFPLGDAINLSYELVDTSDGYVFSSSEL